MDGYFLILDCNVEEKDTKEHQEADHLKMVQKPDYDCETVKECQRSLGMAILRSMYAMSFSHNTSHFPFFCFLVFVHCIFHIVKASC